MKIAVLGWGSLIWYPRELAVSSNWHADGPSLPIEFARMSRYDRVTLVLVPQYDRRNGALWALSSCQDLASACENLRSREETALRHIHYATATKQGSWGPDGPDPKSADVGQDVATWLTGKRELDAAIWTGLPPRGFRTDDPEGLANEVVDFLRNRSGDGLRRAKEYVQYTPSSIRTPVREAIERQLCWMPEPLPEHLVE